MMFNDRKISVWLKTANLFGLVLVIAVNALANILPLNGITTGEVSDSFPNLFAPAGFTFSIWGVIYVGLAMFVAYNFDAVARGRYKESVDKIGWLFFVSCLLNAAWIVLWHYLQIEYTMAVMALLLLVLLRIHGLAREGSNHDIQESIFVKWPFSIYAGWVTIATVANATALLVKLRWDGLGLSEEIWTVAMIIVAALVVSTVTTTRRDVVFGGVFLWTLFGIYSKHQAVFEGAYPKVIIACFAAGAFTIAAMAYGFAQKQKDKRKMFF